MISFQDINSELDKKELDAWQKIIRVLTDEIMSSISSISSLSEQVLLNLIRDSIQALEGSGTEKRIRNRIEFCQTNYALTQWTDLSKV